MANPSPIVQPVAAAPTAQLTPDQQKTLKRMESLVNTKMRMMVGSNGPRYFLSGARGTQSSPTQLLNGDRFFTAFGQAYHSGSAFRATLAIGGFASEDQTGTAGGSQWRFETTANTTTTRSAKLIICGDGGVNIGSSTTSPGAGVLSIAATTASTSTTTGALVVSGGVGVAGAIYGGGVIYSSAATFMIGSKTTYNNGAAAAAGTLLNAPAAGNPTKWIPVDDNGTTRYVPAW